MTMPGPVVAALRCRGYEPARVQAAVARQFELLGGLGTWIHRGDRVLVKPNFIAPRPPAQPAQTHPQVILAVVHHLRDLGARPLVADSPAWGTVAHCARALDGLDRDLRHLGVPLRRLGAPRRCRINPHTTVGISATALEVDAIVNLPKLKAHQQMVATLAVKNLFGCVAGKAKPYWHFARGADPDRFADFLLDLYRFRPATLSLVDGIVAMQGRGPINGDPCDLGWLVAGPDAVACEVVCAALVGLAPADLPLLRAAVRAGYGTHRLDQVILRGDPLPASPPVTFRIPAQIPVRFSLGRVLRSVAAGVLRSLRPATRPNR